MTWTASLLTLMMAAADGAAPEPIGSLADLRWNYRVILVFSQEPLASAAVDNLEQYRSEVEDRDIAWFVLSDDSLRTNFPGKRMADFQENLITTYFSGQNGETAVVLVGKDGTVKSRTRDLDLEATFGLIDQMPMRMNEMNNRNRP